MNETTAGQVAYEAWRGDDDASGLMPPWRGLYDGDKTRWERIAPAVETEQVRLAREDRDQLRKRVLDLAAIDPDKLDLLADWFDVDDLAKGRSERTEVQEDLRRWATLVRKAREAS